MSRIIFFNVQLRIWICQLVSNHSSCLYTTVGLLALEKWLFKVSKGEKKCPRWLFRDDKIRWSHFKYVFDRKNFKATPGAALALPQRSERLLAPSQTLTERQDSECGNGNSQQSAAGSQNSGLTREGRFGRRSFLLHSHLAFRIKCQVKQVAALSF